MNPRYLSCIVLFILMLTSCKPTIRECTGCLAKKFNNTIRVIQSEKKNGIESIRNGFNIYEVYFSCTIEFVDDFEIKSPMFGVFEKFSKGEKFQIEDAYCRFAKTDNGWTCNAVDYNALSGFYYIDADGNKISASEYYKRKEMAREEEPRIFVGGIDNYMPYASVKLKKIKTTLSGIIYNRETKDAKEITGHENNNIWIIDIPEVKGLRLNCNAEGALEGECFQYQTKIGNFRFRETSFSWQQAKNYDMPKSINYISAGPVVSATEKRIVHFYVITTRAYFYDSPDISTRRNSYLVKGEKLEVIKEVGDFIYTEFTNAQGIVTKGWLRSEDLNL